MRPITTDRAEVVRAYVVTLSGHEGEIFLEDLELTYLYQRSPAWGDVLADCPEGVDVAAWTLGAQSVVRRLKALMLHPEIMNDDDETLPDS